MIRHRLAVPVALLAALIVCSLGVSLLGEFVWDDRPLIVENRLIKDPGEIRTILTSSFWQTGDQHDRFRSFFRPLITLSYALDYAVWGLRPFGFHLMNLLLHLLCSVLVYKIALAEQLAARPALWGAALFAVHPVHVESVAWISGRTDLLCALFLLGAFLAHRAACEDGSRLGWGGRAVSLGLFAMALFSKEAAAPLPALVFADRWFTDGPQGRRLRSALAASWPYAAVLLVYVVVRLMILGGEAQPLYQLGGLSYAATFVFVLARYTTLLLLPIGLDAHYPYSPIGSPLAPTAAVSALIVGVVVVSLVVASRRWPRSAFWIAWILLGLAPVMRFGTFGDVLLADRFLYLPSVGLAILFGFGLSAAAAHAALPRRALAVAASGALVVAGCGAIAFHRSRAWKDDFTLFSGMVRTSPQSAMVHSNYGLALYGRRDYVRAREEFETAIELVPGYTQAYNNLAASYDREGNLERAFEYYREALRLAPGQIETQVNLGGLLVRLDRKREGMAILRAIVRSRPRYAPALYALADAYDKTGSSEEALPYALLARAIDPFYANPHYLLGKIYFERGDYAGAADAMRRFLSLWREEGPHREAALRVIERAKTARAVRADPAGTGPKDAL